MEALQNITGSPKSSFKALLLSIFTCVATIVVGALGAAVTSAAGSFAATGNVTNWQQYAAAGVVGVVTFLGSGALQKDIAPVKAAIDDVLPAGLSLGALSAVPAVSNITDNVMQAGLAYLTQAATSKLQADNPELAAAVNAALSAHATQPAPAVA